MTGNEYVLRALAAEGMKNIFLVPGGLIDPFLPVFAKVPEIKPIVAAQEGGAAYMADGYARASGNFGTCMSIGGPGLTNMTTAISTAYTDGSGILVLSGEVPTNIEGCGQFQDASAGTFNDSEILENITVYSESVENPLLLRHHLNTAMVRMLSQPRRPVHISLPQDAQLAEVKEPYEVLSRNLSHGRIIDPEAASQLWGRIRPDGSAGAPARKIAILAGSGVLYSDASDALRQFAERFSIPVATTQKAKGALPEDHPLSLGVFGYAGTRHATAALLSGELDLLIILGSSMKVRDTMYWSEKLSPKRGSVIVNVSPSEIGEIHIRNKLPVVADIRTFLNHLLTSCSKEEDKLLRDGISMRQEWVKEIRSNPRFYDDENCSSDQVPIHPARVISDLTRVMPEDTVLLVDSGAHRAFAVHYWESKAPGLFLSATNLGPMGWAIPAAVGAKLARPELPCAVITGDGCMLMHGMEIQTAKRYDLPIIYVVLNNAALGNVWLRAHQEGPVPAELTSLPDHDWAGFARSLGLEASTVTNPGDLTEAYKRALASGTTYLIDVKVDKDCATPIEPYQEEKKLWSYQE